MPTRKYKINGTAIVVESSNLRYMQRIVATDKFYKAGNERFSTVWFRWTSTTSPTQASEKEFIAICLQTISDLSVL